MKLKKITIRVDEEDLNKLVHAYPQLGYNELIRLLMRSFVNKINKKTHEEFEV